MKTLVIGGVRSGKSRAAERLARESGLEVVYIATAASGDAEMHARIAEHRARRPPTWTLIEEPRSLGAVLRRKATPGHCLLVDCLTLWLTNLLCSDDEEVFDAERHSLLEALPELAGDIILVSNETNMGVVPLGALSRRYCDAAGSLHQEVAMLCDRVLLTVAGIPHVLKGNLS